MLICYCDLKYIESYVLLKTILIRLEDDLGDWGMFVLHPFSMKKAPLWLVFAMVELEAGD